MFRVLTVEREYGAGGGAIARIVAETLGWRLLDRALLNTVARIGEMDAETVARHDEHVDSWWRRFHRQGLWAAAIYAGIPQGDQEFFGADAVSTLTRRVITKAADTGNCVIVGRGAQCVLQDHPDALHVFVYGPWQERVSRVRGRVNATRNFGRLIRSADHERAKYIRTYYGCDWKDPHLYNLMISSYVGLEDAAWMVAEALLHGGPVPLYSETMA